MSNSTMIGIGLTPEGINQNYVIYELMLEMGYRKEPVDLPSWFENYSARRYGAWGEYATKAWRKLGLSIYDYIGLQNIRGHYVITKSPSLEIAPWAWYDAKIIFNAWDLLLRARHGNENSTLYTYDVVDLTRQILQMTADHIYPPMIAAYWKKNITEFRNYSNLLLDVFDDLESILATNERFLLGSWLSDAKALGTNQKERDNYEYNAKNQITLWGPNGEIKDYANKQWSGVVKDYFKRRWVVFLKALDDSLEKKTEFNKKKVKLDIFQNVELPFTTSKEIYPTKTKGESINIAMKLNSKWRYKSEYLFRKWQLPKY